MPEDPIHLGIGQPSPDLLPLNLLRSASGNALTGDNKDCLGYGPARGNPDFKDTLAGFLTEHTPVAVRPDQLMTTNGNSQALDLLCTLLTRPGDTVLVEAPTYFLALRIFTDYGLNLVTVPTDEDGLIPEALEEILADLPGDETPAFLYTIPFFHNPSSVTMSAGRLERLATISADRNLRVISDEVYWFLHFDAPPPPSLGRFLDKAPVYCLGSFSKILAPGLRLGWIHTARERVRQLARAGVIQSGGGVNPFTSAVVGDLMTTGDLTANISHLRTVLRARADALCRMLEIVLPPAARFETPRGGYFVWIRFPEGIDFKALRKELQAMGVDIYPGQYFSPEKGFSHCMRLCFAYYDETVLTEGAARLGKALKSILPELYT
ncbi:MAG TPA: PLP-dependent aminotransferase family protein [Desulfobacteraceae bacterium]|nr:PLP-dependent aminotransferase family protein [Desulfobacteraceae bacterium]